jgi:hypothetical protein
MNSTENMFIGDCVAASGRDIVKLWVDFCSISKVMSFVQSVPHGLFGEPQKRPSGKGPPCRPRMKPIIQRDVQKPIDCRAPLALLDRACLQMNFTIPFYVVPPVRRVMLMLLS